MKHIYITTAFVLLSLVPAVGQKVKYKDLFVLLNAENYRDADVFLRRFLAAEPEHPHANYSMGKMLQTYMLAQEPLQNSARIMELADSAILYYQKARGVLTEKFVKKHDDDYFVEFRRRDLRTGKFNVKLSDIQLDMDGRIKAIEDYTSWVGSIKQHFSAARANYDSCRAAYQHYVAKAPDRVSFYFTISDTDLQNLKKLSILYDSAIYHLNTYRTTLKDMGKKDRVQTIKIKEIVKYPEDGTEAADFNAKEITLWNYGAWAETMHDIVARKIYPLKDRIIAYDKQLMDLHNEVIDDSLDARSKTFRLATENVGRELSEYGDPTLPAAIFNYRIAEINYHSAVNHMHKEVLNSPDMQVKYDALKDLTAQLAGISRLVLRLKEANNDRQKFIFKDYIASRYQDNDGLDRFVQEQVEFVAFDSIQLQNWYKLVDEQDKFVIWNTDSIPLVPGEQLLNFHDKVRYTTVFVDSIAERTLGFYAWQEKIDSLSLLFGVAPASRMIDSLFAVTIDPKLVVQRTSNIAYLTDTLGNKQRVWALTAEDKAGKANFLVQAFVTDPHSGLRWNKVFHLKKQPVTIRYDADPGQILLIDDKEKPILVLNKDGEEQDKAN